MGGSARGHMCWGCAVDATHTSMNRAALLAPAIFFHTNGMALTTARLGTTVLTSLSLQSFVVELSEASVLGVRVCAGAPNLNGTAEQTTNGVAGL